MNDSAHPVTFNPVFMSGTGAADLSRFQSGNPILPGLQSVQLIVNDGEASRHQVRFSDSDGRIDACFTRDLLVAAGVDIDRLALDGHTLDGDCLDLQALIPHAQVRADAGDMSLNVKVPQRYVRRSARGYVDPALWSHGQTAMTLAYSLSMNDSRAAYSDARSAYLGINTGINVGLWQLRSQAYYNWAASGPSAFANTSTRLERDIDALRSRLTIGDAFTQGQLFNSVAFRGITLATDDRMLPDSLTGYAPVVRGHAETSAVVEVRQRDYIIYRMNVAPGPFEITDLPSAGYSGDLEVIVKEADGRERTFTVPFASVPSLLRPGASRYALVAGRMRGTTLLAPPHFIEATYQRGLTNMLTAYAGMQATDRSLYRSAMVGAAVNTPAGAFSADIASSQVRVSNTPGAQRGHSMRAAYNKTLPASRTNISLAAFRYSTQGYADLAQATDWDNRIRQRDGIDGKLEDRGVERHRFVASIGQELGVAGSITFSGSRHQYWSSHPVSSRYQFGWRRRFGDGDISLNLSRTYIKDAGYDTSIGAAFTMPLGSRRSARDPNLAVGLSRDGAGTHGVRVGVTGATGERSQINYGVDGDFRGDQASTLGVHAGYRGAYGTVNASHTYGSTSRASGLSATGGIVVHPGGITLASALGDQLAVVEAKGASGAVLNDGISRVDRRGYVVAGSLSPYRVNDVWLDPKGTSFDVEVGAARTRVVPRAGAVIPVRFDTTRGTSWLLHLTRSDGDVIPFGAEVVTSSGTVVGIVGQQGKALVRLQDDTMPDLRVRLSSSTSCTVDWRPEHATANAAGLRAFASTCTAH